MVDLVNYHSIKGPDSKELEIVSLLQKPGVEQKIQAIAATLTETFSVQTKLLVDIRPGAIFVDTHINQEYIYEGAFTPYDHDALTTVILREARHPVEELKDQAYFLFRESGVNGKRQIIAGKDFIKYFAIDRWKLIDACIGDEKEITRKLF